MAQVFVSLLPTQETQMKLLSPGGPGTGPAVVGICLSNKTKTDTFTVTTHTKKNLVPFSKTSFPWGCMCPMEGLPVTSEGTRDSREGPGALSSLGGTPGTPRVTESW